MVSGEPLPKELAKGPIRHSQELFFFLSKVSPPSLPFDVPRCQFYTVSFACTDTREQTQA